MNDFLAKYAYGISAACLGCALQSREQATFWHEHFVIGELIGMSIPLNIGAGLLLTHLRPHLALYIMAGLFMGCGVAAIASFMFAFGDGLGVGFLLGCCFLGYLFGQLIS